MTETNECDMILAEIQLYIDGEVTATRRTKLEAHLSTCTPCMHRAEFQTRLKEIVRSKCSLEAPDHLVLRIRRIIRSDP
jgi:mycothiol system anti-sigma-R factor